MPASRLRLPPASRLFNLKADVEGSNARLRRLRNSSTEQRRYLAPIRRLTEDLLQSAAFSLALWGKPSTFHFLFKVQPRRGPPFLVRLHRFDSHAKHFQIEAWVDAHRGMWKIPGPAVLQRGRLPGPLRLAYLVMRFNEGRPLNEFSAPARREVCWRETGRLLARVHRVRLGGFGPLVFSTAHSTPRGVKASWGEFLRTKLRAHVTLCRSIGAISADEAARIGLLFRRIPDVSAARLLHGDLNDQNVLVQGTRISALLDWEDALAGDPVFDLALWGTFHERGALVHVLNGYRRVAQLPGDFEYRYWLYFLRIALAKTVHRHRFGYPDRPAGPPASQRIQWALAHLPVA